MRSSLSRAIGSSASATEWIREMSEGRSGATWPVAGGLDLGPALRALGAQRPVFHSEADFQHHLAWQIHLAEPRLQLRLEIRPDPALREQLDLLVRDPATGAATAIELKYLKARWEGVIDGEAFSLLNQGAHDITRYDIVKDVARVERFVAARPDWNGYTVALTNDPAYWKAPARAITTIDAAFRVHEGVALTGERAWGSAAGEGTIRGRRAPLALDGDYSMEWTDYSRLMGARGEFRVLVVPAQRS